MKADVFPVVASVHPIKLLFGRREAMSRNTSVFAGITSSFYRRTFSPDKPCSSLHTQKTRQVFFEAEPDFWMIMVSS